MSRKPFDPLKYLSPEEVAQTRADLERADNAPVSFDADEELSRTQLARKVMALEADVERLQDLVCKFQNGGTSALYEEHGA